jgi:hypothetical protein
MIADVMGRSDQNVLDAAAAFAAWRKPIAHDTGYFVLGCMIAIVRYFVDAGSANHFAWFFGCSRR